jgi:hypothetical protein
MSSESLSGPVGLIQGSAAGLAAPSPSNSALVTMEAEVPEGLHDGLQTFLQRRPDWDTSFLLTSALASFLVQNGWSDPFVAGLYLDVLDRGGDDGVITAA